MNFTSLEFFLFFPAVLILHWLLPWRFRWVLLLSASYLFYMSWNPWMALLLFASTFLSYFSARKMENKEKKAKKPWLSLALIFCLGSLALFKYLDFFLENISGLAERINGSSVSLSLHLILPVGISFYTFQTLAYVIDVYRGKISCENHFGYYALYVSFFPQLVAGPIERPDSLLPQLKKERRFSSENLCLGAWLMLRGFFKKLAVADYLAVFVEGVYASPQDAAGISVLLGTVFFALQIYCDFSGYTDIARGASLMLGIRLMENFLLPYRAENIREFWRRWHVSLTGWFTDYVYIPLGGSRAGLFRHCRNIWIVFALSGLWHGASWNFVLWGMFHGLLLTGSLLWNTFIKSPQKEGVLSSLPWLGRLRTFLLVCLGWIFFRAESMGDVWLLLQNLFHRWSFSEIAEGINFMGIRALDALLLFLVFFCLFLIEKIPERVFLPSTEKEASQAVLTAFYLITVIALSWLIRLASNGGNAFLYFQF